MQPITWPIITVVSAAFLTACASPTTPTPTPAPTYSCTPEQGGSPTPCSANEHEQAQKRDNSYKQAEAVFRRYWTEMGRLSLLEDPTFTNVLAETTTGVFEQDLIWMFGPSWNYSRRVNGEVKLVRVSRLLGHARSGSTVALEVCIDASQAQYVKKGSDRPTRGKIWSERVYFSATVDGLKIVNSESRDVETC